VGDGLVLAGTSGEGADSAHPAIGKVTQPHPDDDPSVEDAEWLYRRIPSRQARFDDNRGERWPSSASMCPSSGDDDVSVYIGSLLNDPLDVLDQHPTHGLVRFRAGTVRAAGAACGAALGIVRDPITDAERPLRCDPAHALIRGVPPGSKRSRTVARELVYETDMEWVVRPPADADTRQASATNQEDLPADGADRDDRKEL